MATNAMSGRSGSFSTLCSVDTRHSTMSRLRDSSSLSARVTSSSLIPNGQIFRWKRKTWSRTCSSSSQSFVSARASASPTHGSTSVPGAARRQLRPGRPARARIRLLGAAAAGAVAEPDLEAGWARPSAPMLQIRPTLPISTSSRPHGHPRSRKTCQRSLRTAETRLRSAAPARARADGSLEPAAAVGLRERQWNSSHAGR
jgi:hypothetical protein